MGRKPSYDDNGRKKGAWSPEEDKKLTDYIVRYGHWNWRELPKYAGLARCGKSCRLRWMNYLRPSVKRGGYTDEEEDIIIKSHELLGNKWSAIAAKLPGRTDNEIKNHWHTHLKKRVLHQNKSNSDLGKIDEQSTDGTVQSGSKRRRRSAPEEVVDLPQPAILESSSSSPISNLSFDSAILPGGMINSAMEDISSTPLETIDDFWNQPFLSVDYNQNTGLSSPLVLEGEFLTQYDHLYYDDCLDYSFPAYWE